MRRSNFWRWLGLAALASVALVVTACGSDDKDSSSSSSSSTTSSTSSGSDSGIPAKTQSYSSRQLIEGNTSGYADVERFLLALHRDFEGIIA